jgi:transposase InsO family protein
MIVTAQPRDRRRRWSHWTCGSRPTASSRRLAVFAWIEGWYQPHRRHSILGRRSPIEHERSLAATPTVVVAAKP